MHFYNPTGGGKWYSRSCRKNIVFEVLAGVNFRKEVRESPKEENFSKSNKQKKQAKNIIFEVLAGVNFRKEVRESPKEEDFAKSNKQKKQAKNIIFEVLAGAERERG